MGWGTGSMISRSSPNAGYLGQLSGAMSNNNVGISNGGGLAYTPEYGMKTPGAVATPTTTVNTPGHTIDNYATTQPTFAGPTNTSQLVAGQPSPNAIAPPTSAPPPYRVTSDSASVFGQPPASQLGAGTIGALNQGSTGAQSPVNSSLSYNGISAAPGTPAPTAGAYGWSQPIGGNMLNQSASQNPSGLSLDSRMSMMDPNWTPQQQVAFAAQPGNADVFNRLVASNPQFAGMFNDASNGYRPGAAALGVPTVPIGAYGNDPMNGIWGPSRSPNFR